MSDSSYLSKPWLVVINPVAGNGIVQQKWLQFEVELSQILPQATFVFTQKIEALQAIVHTALRKGTRHFMAVGGDGSAHQLVNAIMQQDLVASTDITFALLPLGTGNDWIKTHQIPRKWVAWKKFFQHAEEKYQNVGRIHFNDGEGIKQRYFINVAGLAYDAFVVKEALNKTSFLSGKLYYLWLGLSCLPKYNTQKASLNFDRKQVTKRFYTINIGIGQYSGGGMQLVPHAVFNDSYFGLTFVGHLSRLAVFFNSFRFYKGRIAGLKEATLVKAKKITIHSKENMLIEADGEFLGQCPVAIELLDKKLKFVG